MSDPSPRCRASTPSRWPCCAAGSNRWPTRWTRRSTAAPSIPSSPRRTTPATASTTPRRGDTLVQGKSGLPVFVGAMAFAVRATAKAAEPRGGMRDGDIWIINDAYDGGTHANDFKLVRPFFRNGKLYCYMASAAHWHDVGGAVPGNYNPAATECWQEAVQIPPVRIVRDGVLDPDVLAILQRQHAPARQPLGRPQRPARRARTRRAAAGRPARRIRRRRWCCRPWASCAAARCG